MIIFRAIRGFLVWIYYILFTERVLNKMDELAKDVKDMDRLHGFTRGFGSHWYARKICYLWIKRNRKDGIFKFKPCPHRIKAKELWDTAPIKKVDESLIGKYLYVFRDEVPKEIFPWKYEYSETFNQTGKIVEVKFIGVRYQSINNSCLDITQCRFATQKEIMNHMLEVFEEESIRNCKKYNVLPVILENYVGDQN